LSRPALVYSLRRLEASTVYLLLSPTWFYALAIHDSLLGSSFP
jgi:hypothetical protein